MTKVLLNGKEFDFDVVVNYMDDEIREELHNEIAPCDEQAFINAYCEAHEEKYNQKFDIN